MTIKVYYDYKRKSMKIISFSVWGSDQRYFDGAIENAILTKKIYGPEWTARFYCDKNVPESLIKDLKGRHAQIEICENDKGPWYGLFWRFYPAGEDDVDIVLSRDIDSRLNSREKAAVFEWMNSGTSFHIMRDHFYHDVYILGGMWGARKGTIKNIKKLILDWGIFGHKGCDQEFLAKIVYPMVVNNSMIHDEVMGEKQGWNEATRKKWPKHRPIEWGEHVGAYIFKRVLKW